MSLTTGKGPLSARRAGRFNVPIPDDLVYAEPFQRRVRGVHEGRTVVDSERVLLVHRQGQPPSYAFPADDVRGAKSEPEAAAAGYVHVPWDAVEEWYEETERVYMHPRNPYHRVDIVPTTRHLRVEMAGVVLVDTHDTVGLYESTLPPRLYVAREHVDTAVLTRSDTSTYCPYKGWASYWTATVGDTVVEDVAWSYDDPHPESLPVATLLAFDPSKATVTQDLPAPAEVPPTA